ncbi:MAG: hypothetical protein ACYDGM_09410 [Vulcanimicrobiaceae bacterium]
MPVLTPARPARPTATKAPAHPGEAAAKAVSDAAVATQSSAFDLSQAESSELQRELEALDEMMMAQLKDEDAILKKWIAMIG